MCISRNAVLSYLAVFGTFLGVNLCAMGVSSPAGNSTQAGTAAGGTLGCVPMPVLRGVCAFGGVESGGRGQL